MSKKSDLNQKNPI